MATHHRLVQIVSSFSLEVEESVEMSRPGRRVTEKKLSSTQSYNTAFCFSSLLVAHAPLHVRLVLSVGPKKIPFESMPKVVVADSGSIIKSQPKSAV